jgi:hypothetical protein
LFLYLLEPNDYFEATCRNSAAGDGGRASAQPLSIPLIGKLKKAALPAPFQSPSMPSPPAGPLEVQREERRRAIRIQAFHSFRIHARVPRPGRSSSSLYIFLVGKSKSGKSELDQKKLKEWIRHRPANSRHSHPDTSP